MCGAKPLNAARSRNRVRIASAAFVLVTLAGCVDQKITSLAPLTPRRVIGPSDPATQVPLVTTATAINDAGWVGGGTLGYYGSNEAFIWDGTHAPQALDFQVAYGINSTGDTVGMRFDSRLGPVGASINDSDEVVGTALHYQDYLHRAKEENRSPAQR
jgi:hypothetical protein